MAPGQRENLGQRKLLLGVLCAMALGLTYGIVLGQQGVSRYLELSKAYEERSAMVRSRVERNESVRERLVGLRTSDEVLEKTARLQLGVVEENEIVYVFGPR